MSKTLKELCKQLKAMADPAIAEHSQRFFKTGKGEYGEGDKFLGLRVHNIRALVKQFKTLSLSDTLILLSSKFHEERLCAVLLLVQHFEKDDEQTRGQVYKAYLNSTRFINNWDIVDSSAHQIVGAHLVDKNRAVLKKLAKSENLWERRIAIIATFHFIRRHDFKDALAISKQLLKDEEDLIHKAVGWMLREIGKRDKAVEIEFLDLHYKEMPRTMLRYAIEKFPEKQRKYYLLSR